MYTAAKLSREELSKIQNSSRKVILVVEDDVTLQPIVRRMFRKLSPDATIEWATDVDNAITLIEGRTDHGYDLILADVFLDGDRSGLDLVRECEAIKIEASCVVTSGEGEGILGGAKYPFLPKPFSFDSFKSCVGPLLSDALPIEPFKHRKNWFWPLTMALLAGFIGAGVSRLAMKAAGEAAPVILDYDIARDVRWASLKNPSAIPSARL